MKTIKIQIKNIFGNLLFEHESEKNSIKETLENANLENADLRFADLENANLRNADLEKADLRNANLRNSNLRNSNLEFANLRNANLRFANLENANLEGADLEKADLRNANLRNSNLEKANLEGAINKNRAFLPIFCKWNHSVIGDKIQIGCKQKTISDWDLFFESNEEYLTSRKTDDFKQIQAVFLAYKAYITHLL